MMVTAVGLNSAQGQILGSISGAAPSATGDGLRCAATSCIIGQVLLVLGCEVMGFVQYTALGTRVPTWLPSHLGGWQ